jgi:hypothetical protein
VPEPTAQPAIFLSYARDDAAAARRIAEALRASGLLMWFDENELRGGDAWDSKIRRQINECVLFIALISSHTEARAKGYFRLEWKLAVEQTHLLAEGVPFIAPVVIDDTREAGAVVPAEFLKVQWTRLPGALPTPQFVEQIKRLLAAAPVAGMTVPPVVARVSRPVSPETTGQETRATPAAPRRLSPAAPIGAFAAIAIGVGTTFIATRKRPAAPPPATEKFSPAAPKADAKSIAVLPFENLSPEPDSAFVADGIHDEVLTAV